MKKLLKVLFTPIIFLLNLAQVIGGLIFPTTFVIIASFWLILYTLLVRLLNLSLTNKIEEIEPFIEDYGNLTGHFLGLTVLIWFPFYSVYCYWTEDKLSPI